MEREKEKEAERILMEDRGGDGWGRGWLVSKDFWVGKHSFPDMTQSD